MQALNHRIFCAFLSLAWACNASAQSTEEEEDLALAYGDKSTISIATGSPQLITRAPSAATVITARDIIAMGATDLDQVLESVPGVHVFMNNIALSPIHGFRGIATGFNPQVLTLVNGIPITESYSSGLGVRWGGMPLENVARIEVIRGPGSALYGADAFSGVINVVTKTAEDIRGTEYGLRAGSFNSRDAWIQHGGKLGALEAMFYLGVGNSDGQKGIIQRDAQSTWDSVLGTNSSRAPGPINAERKALDARTDLSYEAWRFRAAYQQRELGLGTGLAASLDPSGRWPASRLYLDMSYEQANWAPNWDVSAVISYYNIQNKLADPATTLYPSGAFAGVFPNGMIGSPAGSEDHSHASFSAFYTGFKQHRVRLGVGHRIDNLYDVSEIKNFDTTFAPLPGGVTDVTGNPALVYMLPHKRNLNYVFAQDEWNLLKDWTLTTGVRHDSYSDFGTTTNPRLALVWDATYNLVIKAMHGTAFRAPSFAELYAINNPVTIGNTSLKPETITTDELAFSWKPSSNLQTNLNFFNYRMSNIILPISGATYQNSGDQTGRGLELEATLDATNNLRLTGNFSLQHSTDEATGQDAGLSPHKHLFVRADWHFKSKWQLGATANRVMERMREPGDTRAQIPDYTTVSLTLRREKLLDNFDVRASITNLFNSDAREPTLKSAGVTTPNHPITISDLPLPQRAFYIQIQHKL